MRKNRERNRKKKKEGGEKASRRFLEEKFPLKEQREESIGFSGDGNHGYVG